MHLPYVDKIYLLKIKLKKLNEQDRAIVLGLCLLFLFLLWYFVLFTNQKASLKDINEKISHITQEAGQINQKKNLVESLSNNPNAKKLLERYKLLSQEITNLDKKLIQIKPKETASSIQSLSVLLHAILKETPDISIDDFSSLNPQSDQTAASSEAAEKKVADNLSLFQPIYYQLKIKGPYFSIMAYLKRLENSKATLYWDNFEYQVINYPEASASLEFYTLKAKDSYEP